MNGLSLSAANKFPHEEIWGLYMYIKSPTLESNSLRQTKSAVNEYNRIVAMGNAVKFQYSPSLKQNFDRF